MSIIFMLALFKLQGSDSVAYVVYRDVYVFGTQTFIVVIFAY
jgi:hypothetical protein